MDELRAFAPLNPPFNTSSYKLNTYKNHDLPLRAKSVCLTERPRSKYERHVHSAGTRTHNTKQFFQTKNNQSSAKSVNRQKTKVQVKQQNRKSVEKVPCAISVQTISIPMKYANYGHSTSKSHQNLCNVNRIDNRTKSSNLPKQVGDNKRLCSTARGKETENRLLVQIREAKQVVDFERILNSNSIGSERAPQHKWHEAGAVSPRPCSAYSLHAVSQAYHYLFRQHHESLKPLIDSYRRTQAKCPEQPTPSLLQDNWYENLRNLSEFYEDDPALKRELETINDKILSEELKATDSALTTCRNKNFNVNLTDLIGLHVNGEGYLGSNQDSVSPDVDTGDHEVYDEKEWLTPIMSSDDHQHSEDKNHSVECLAQDFNSVKIDSDGKVPTITFSNCCDACKRTESPINPAIDIRLTVPSIDSNDETRPPMI